MRPTAWRIVWRGMCPAARSRSARVGLSGRPWRPARPGVAQTCADTQRVAAARAPTPNSRTAAPPLVRWPVVLSLGAAVSLGVTRFAYGLLLPPCAPTWAGRTRCRA